MGVTIIEQPRAVDFAENPIRFVLEGAESGFPSAKSVVIIGRVSAPLEGDSIRVQFGNGDYDFTFLFVAVPDDSGLELTAGASLAVTMAELMSFYYLGNLYDITSADPLLNLTAKQAGAYCSMTVTLDCAGLVVNSNVPGGDALLLPGYRIFTKLQVENDGAFGDVATMLLFVDEVNRVELNLNKILHAVFDKMDKPDVLLAVPVLATEILRRYRLTLAEFYGDPAQVRKSILTEALTVINGKSPFNVWPDEDFVSDVIVGGKWLSDSLAKVETWTNAPQYVAWFNGIGSMTVKQRVRINYMDGSQSEHFLNQIDSVLNQVIIFPAGRLQLGLNTGDDFKVFSYEVCLVTETAPFDVVNIGRSITFLMIEQPKMSRVFLFQNNFGAPETLLCTGIATRDLAVKRTQFRSQESTHEVIFSDVDEVDETFECSTGHVEKAQAEFMISAMASKYFYLKIFDKWEPVKVLDGSLKILDETADTIAFKFKYQYYFKNKTARLERSSNYRSYSEDYEDGYQ